MVSTCPHTSATNFFGSFISFDAVHPSGLAQQAVADTLAGRINAAFGLSLQ